MAKTEEDLKLSREERLRINKKYGDIPISMVSVDFSKNALMPTIERTQNFVAEEMWKGHEDYLKWSKREKDAFTVSGKNVRGKGKGLSIFPYDLAKQVILFYSDEGDIIFDPCAGHITRMWVTYMSNRSYIGYDVSKEFYELNCKIRDTLLGIGSQEKLLDINNGCSIDLVLHSSIKVNLGDRSMDLIFTSPPYWDIEFYGDESGQLGYNKTYKGFLQGLEMVFSESFRVLKQHKYAVFNINDFRKDGTLYDFHNDVIKIGRKVGFDLHDIRIVNWKNSIASVFASQVEDRKVSGKAHEYLVVFKKNIWSK